MVRGVAYRILRDAAEADDLLQEVFLFVFRKWALFDASRGSARSWIVQVTYHRAIDRRRHLASRHFYANAELDETLLTIDGPMADTAFYERSIEGSLGTEMLSKIEEALSIDQRRTIQLYFFDGYTFEEIAGFTGQMVGNVRNHYYRGLEKIRKLVFAPELRDEMSDMLEHGASGGAEPLPPSESHDEFLELCATATTGSLSAEERRRLKEHLAQCGSCREIMAQYQAIVDRVIPAWAADPVEEKRAPGGWSQEEAEAQLFARLGEAEPSQFSANPGNRNCRRSRWHPRTLTSSSGDALWRHVWVQFAAALFLVAALGLIAYRTGIRRGLDLAPSASMPTSSRPTSGSQTGPEIAASDRSPCAGEDRDQPTATATALRIQLEERMAEIERLKVQLTQTRTELNDKESDRIRLAQQSADLSHQLELASANLESDQQKLSSIGNQNSLDSAHAAALEEKVNQLTAS